MDRKDIDSLIDTARSGIPVVTVNLRLSRYLHICYDQRMREKGETAWESPFIIPLSSWFEYLWNENWQDKPILSTVRSRILWEKVVSKDKIISEMEIMSPAGIADTSYEAYSLANDYCLSLKLDDIYLTEETAAFNRWVSHYNEELNRMDFIDRVQLPNLLLKLIDGETITLPKAVILAGFDEMTPRLSLLIKLMERNGTGVLLWPQKTSTLSGEQEFEGRKTQIIIRRYRDIREEVIQLARWLSREITPDMRIGIIVPELDRYRESIARELLAELNPSAMLLQGAQDVFNISLGRPLNEEPLVKSAIDIISIDAGKEDINKISSLILSPYVAANEGEFMGCALLDSYLRDENTLYISLKELQKRIIVETKRGTINIPVFLGKLEKWNNELARERFKRPPSRWAEIFSNLLNDLQWPSHAVAMESYEYQSLMAWNELLADFASLDDIAGCLERKEAVSRLQSMAKGRLYQPESPETSIQVLGVLESAGQYFDHIWFLGAHDGAFPSQPSPNPFIPLNIQKRFNLPHSSPEREHAFAKVVLGRILCSSPAMDVSFPSMIDERECLLSPLFKSMHVMEDSSTIEQGNRMKDILSSRRHIEELPAEECIEFLKGESDLLKGGVSILRDQSSCPFKAFATFRLGARVIPIPRPGLLQRERGRYVHTILKAVWDEIGDSRRLKSMMEGNELTDLVNKIVSRVIRSSHLHQLLSRRFIEIEKELVILLVEEWMSMESKRMDFRVAEMEKGHEIDIDGLRLKARFDRVDILEDGRVVIMDYKTGQCSRDDWLTDRPRDPQMLLYNLSGNYDAVVFGVLKRGECGFRGISKDKDAVPGVMSFNEDKRWRKKLNNINDWQELMDKWRKTVKNLARDFLNGVLPVDPNSYANGQSACDRCELGTLCRIAELRAY